MPQLTDHAAPTIRSATVADADTIVVIYNHYVTETIVTFEEVPITASDIVERMQSVWSAGLPWLVAETAEGVRGYAYATKWKERIGYRFSVETSVYLAHDAGGRGLGSALYGALFPLLEARGIHAAMGGIALPNDASVALHEKFGMRKVAHFAQPGIKFGQWVDVGYWQRVFGG
jgi:L-amino acid N-acyltransferase YncA